jgi:hypothetical protein
MFYIAVKFYVFTGLIAARTDHKSKAKMKILYLSTENFSTAWEIRYSQAMRQARPRTSSDRTSNAGKKSMKLLGYKIIIC